MCGTIGFGNHGRIRCLLHSLFRFSTQNTLSTRSRRGRKAPCLSLLSWRVYRVARIVKRNNHDVGSSLLWTFYYYGRWTYKQRIGSPGAHYDSAYIFTQWNASLSKGVCSIGRRESFPRSRSCLRSSKGVGLSSQGLRRLRGGGQRASGTLRPKSGEHTWTRRHIFLRYLSGLILSTFTALAVTLSTPSRRGLLPRSLYCSV